MSSTASASSSNAKEKHTRKFKKQGKVWVLAEDRSESEEDDAHGHHGTVTVATFDNVKFHRNAKRDAMRHALRPTTEWIPRRQGSAVLPQGAPAGSVASRNGAAPSTSTISVPAGPNRMVIYCGDDCFVRHGPSAPPPPAPPNPMGYDPPCFDDVASTTNDPGSVNVLYQHGFSSSARTWCQMSRYVRERYRVRNEIRHTLNWRASYEDQAADLEGRFRADAASYPGPYVLVGHSNGGLVNRYMAQNIWNQSLVRGVVTISSPHSGVYVANMSERLVVGLLSVPALGYLQGCDVAYGYVCKPSGSLAVQVAAILSPILASSYAPVLQEMGTNAPFHDYINSRGDAAYLVAGVQNRVWDRWSMWRLYGDARCPPSETDCYNFSRSYVVAVDRVYHENLKCAVAAGLLGIFWSGARSTARGCAIGAALVYLTDAAYKRITVGSAHGDAVVPEFSQMYPGAPQFLQFMVDDSGSHIGETRSRRTAQAVLAAINQAMGVPYDQ